MAPFQTISLTFLLLTVLSDIQAEHNCLSCPKHVIAELGKAINVTCKNTSAMVVMGMAFCSADGTNCSALQTIFDKTKIVPVHRNITVNIHHSEVFLTLDQVQISHQRKYRLHAVCDRDSATLTVFLEVFAPYTRPWIVKQNDTLVCTASSGYPEKNLYWVSQTGTNLTYNSTSESVKNVDGTFNLSVTLPLGPGDYETEQCCTFSNTIDPSRYFAPACIIPASTFMVKSSKTTWENSSEVSIPILVVVILSAAVLFAVFVNRRRKKDIKNLFWRTNSSVYQKASFSQHSS